MDFYSTEISGIGNGYTNVLQRDNLPCSLEGILCSTSVFYRHLAAFTALFLFRVAVLLKLSNYNFPAKMGSISLVTSSAPSATFLDLFVSWLWVSMMKGA